MTEDTSPWNFVFTDAMEYGSYDSSSDGSEGSREFGEEPTPGSTTHTWAQSRNTKGENLKLRIAKELPLD